MNFYIQTAAMFVFFVFDKNGLIKSCSSFEDLSVYKFHGPTLTGASLHPPQTFSVRHFGMVEGAGLKVRLRGHLQWHDLPTEFEVTFNGMISLLSFIKIYQLVQKLLGGTHRQSDRLVTSQASLSFSRKLG
jgi:hypothetical protein